MFKNRFILIVGLLSMLLVTMAVSRPISNAPTAAVLGWPPRPVIVRGVDNTLLSDYYERQAALKVTDAADFYQRHPDWVSIQQAVIPVTGSSAASDYFQRHPELIAPAASAVDVNDYILRHPELSTSAETSADMTDYFTRHPELRVPTENIDLSDYFLRH